MLLAIDVGNTQTVMGLYCDDELRFHWRLATNKLHTADEIRAKVLSLLQSERIKPEELSGAVLASVVPQLSLAWSEAVERLVGEQPLACNAESAEGLFAADYPNPSEIGADRVADAIAARVLYGCPVVVVDFGTATNIEVIDENGLFVGGIIAPGVDTSASALFSRATKLGAIDLVAPEIAIGRNTEQAIQSGIVFGEADRVDGLVNRIFDQLGYSATVVATGGLASRVAPLSRTIGTIDSGLTLEGLRLLYQHSKKA